MSESKAKTVVSQSIEERRQRQFRVLKLYAAGKITPNQAIETINDIEKIIYLGQVKPRKQVQQDGKNE